MSMSGLGAFTISEIDAFLQEEKKLADLAETYPPWISGSHKRHWHASWNIEEQGGIVRGSLKFRFEVGYRDCPSIMLVFRSMTVWRVDLAHGGKADWNPHDAHSLGLPPYVVGAHAHSWADNKAYATVNGPKELPYRRPLLPQVRKLAQALLWLGDQANITIAPHQRDFDLPPQSDLPLRG